MAPGRRDERALHAAQVMDTAWGRTPRQCLGPEGADSLFEIDPWRVDDTSSGVVPSAASPLAPLVSGQAAAAPSPWGAPGMAATSSAPAPGSLADAWNPQPKGPSLSPGAQMAQDSQVASGLPPNLASVLKPSATNPQILRGLNNQARGVVNRPEQPDMGFQNQQLLAQGVGQPGVHAVHQQHVSGAHSQDHVALRASLDPSTLKVLESVGTAVHVGERFRAAAHQEKFQNIIGSKAPPEMISSGLDLFRATVGSPPYREVEGAVLSDPTATSGGLASVFRASVLSPKLQAERVKQLETVKKGGEYTQRIISDSEIQAPAEYLAYGMAKTGQRAEGMAPTCVDQLQQQFECSVLEEAINTRLQSRLPVSQSALAMQKSADPHVQPSLTSPPQFATMANPAAPAASSSGGSHSGAAVPKSAQSPKAPPQPQPMVHPETSFCSFGPEDIISRLDSKGTKCPTEHDLMIVGLMAYHLHWSSVLSNLPSQSRVPIQHSIEANLSHRKKYLEKCSRHVERPDDRSMSPTGDPSSRQTSSAPAVKSQPRVSGLKAPQGGQAVAAPSGLGSKPQSPQVTKLDFSSPGRLAGTCSAPGTPRGQNVRHNIFQAVQSRLMTQISTFTGRLQSVTSESRSVASFKVWPNEGGPGGDPVSMERRHEVKDFRYEHVATARDRLEAITIKDSLLSMYPNLVQWLYACEIDDGVLSTGSMKYVALQQFVAPSSKVASFLFGTDSSGSLSELDQAELVGSQDCLRDRLIG